MIYSDRELRAFSTIAYNDLEVRLDYLKRKTGKDAIALSELLNAEEKEELKKEGVTSEELETWKLAAVHENASNGFTACVIQTGDDNAALAFRGSQDMGDFNNFNDWHNNFSGLDGNLTMQQKEVEKCLMDPEIRMALKNQKISMTGHSLGGNLAMHGAIISDQYGLKDQIVQCANLDGQGFSERYIENHSTEIQKMNKQLGENFVHYQASLVGHLLYSPANNLQQLSVEDGAEGFSRHDRDKWIIEEEHFITGDQYLNSSSKNVGKVSRALDKTIYDDNISLSQKIERSTMHFLFDLAVFAIAGYSYAAETANNILDPITDFFTEQIAKIGRQMGANWYYDASDYAEEDAFYLDISSYRSIVNQYDNIPANLNSIATNLRLSTPVPAFSGSSILDAGIQSLVYEIVNLINLINGVYIAASNSAALLDQAAATVRASVNYINQTANDMQSADEEAQKMVSDWASHTGNLMS